MQPFEFIVLSLAVWRISSLLVDESGLLEMFERFRYWIGIRHSEGDVTYALNPFADLFICLWCVSFWIALLIFVAYTFYPLYTFYLSIPLALSTGAIMVSKWMQ